MPEYTAGFKAKMTQKLLSPHGPSAKALSREIGVAQTTLSRWVREARIVSDMGKSKLKKRRGLRTSADKLRIIVETSALADAELGAYLRREGVQEAQLQEWRDVASAALSASKRKKTSPEAKELKKVQKELLRKDKALAEAAALLILKKKADAIWGVVDDDIPENSGL